MLHEEFQIPVFLLGDEQHMNDLNQIIIDFFRRVGSLFGDRRCTFCIKISILTCGICV